MRFTEFGPSIPNALLDARDAGEVVFLCGAGISIPAGLPDFFRLTCDVARRLGCTPESPAGKLITIERRRREGDTTGDVSEPVSFDRIFNRLVRDFGAAQVEGEVVELLRVPRRPNLIRHQALLDLARGPDGHRRLVTTNFDRLFQKADPRLRSYAQPHFPDLAQRDGFNGVVHLHGVLPANAAKPINELLGLVLSSADFGRAYLAEAWATRFVCDLLDRYIVVLLGYSADDPPVRYLLEGLQMSGRIREHRLFALASKDPARSDLDWRERGVTPIVYDPGDGHRHLWDGLYAWAGRARDTGAWRSRVTSLAQTTPEKLKPFERGKVAALCSSKEGALAFASSMPPPAPEWLCVFDVGLRYAEPGRTLSFVDQRNPEVDPLATYGLDDDPPRPRPLDKSQSSPGVDLLRPLNTDDKAARELSIL
ncbi:MAG: SIR2 family protein, partial [Acetobacteraceae bacterium]|nr:SIR2 family protein [Acetobacteraceae bacterium]